MKRNRKRNVIETRTRPQETRPSEHNPADHYGPDAVIVRLGHINIVHLDNPSKETIRKRTEEIMREELRGEAFFDDCPLCREFQKHPYDIVYDRPMDAADEG